MEKVETTTKTVEESKHSFYCDECGKYIGTSEEYDDGWYDTLGDFELGFYIGTWYRIKKCLCNECREKFLTNLTNTLKDMGFKKEDNGILRG